MTVENIEQFYIEVRESEKFDTLARLLDIQTQNLQSFLVVQNAVLMRLSSALKIRGYFAEGIHGDLSQAKRMSVIKKFKEDNIDVLVATDVAARGLDISGVTHVYNFDIPQDPESYVHRIGRTGRAGKHGMAVTFVTPRERGQLAAVEHTTKKRMEKMKTPTLTEALEGQQKAVTERIVNTVENEDLSLYLNQAEEMLQKYSATDLVAAALKSLTKEPDATPVKLTDEAPLPSKRGGYNKSGSNGRQRNGRGPSTGRKDYSGAKRRDSRKPSGSSNRSNNSYNKREKLNK